MNTTDDGSLLDPIHRWDELVAFDPNEFATTFQWAMNAVNGEALICDPSNLLITMPDENGEPADYRLEDQPDTRIIMAMLERYGTGDRIKLHSAIARIFALMFLLHGGGLEPWTRVAAGKEGYTEIAESVVAAAAVVKLNSKLRFPVREFMRAVRQIEAGESRSSSSE